MAVHEVRLGSQGRLVIPAELRERMGAEEGEVYVATVDERGVLTLRTRRQALEALRDAWGRHEDGEPLLSDELVAERRAEADDR